VPSKSALNKRHADINPVGTETVQYHAPIAGSSTDEMQPVSLNSSQKNDRKRRVDALNAELGLSADGKSHQPGTAPANRHEQQALRIDPEAEPGRSIAPAGKKTAVAFDHEIGSGRNEAATPSNPRTR
jgi:hypothetical protein